MTKPMTVIAGEQRSEDGSRQSPKQPRTPLTARQSWPRYRLMLNLIAVLIALCLWQIAAMIKGNYLVFPTPITTIDAMIDFVGDQEQLAQLGLTLRRVVIGFALGSLLGVTVASLLGSSRIVEESLEPVVHFLRSITPVAWVVPATIWFGAGEASLRFIVIYATIFPVILNTLAGMVEITVNKTRMARVFGAGRLRTYSSVVMPHAVPYVLIGMRLSLGYSFMSVVGAEMVAGSDGIGYLIYQSRLFFDTPTMFAGIFMLGIAGLVFDRIFVLVTDRLFSRFYAGQVDR